MDDILNAPLGMQMQVENPPLVICKPNYTIIGNMVVQVKGSIIPEVKEPVFAIDDRVSNEFK